MPKKFEELRKKMSAKAQIKANKKTKDKLDEMPLKELSKTQTPKQK